MTGRLAGLILAAMLCGGAAAEDGAALFEPCRACHSLDPAAKDMAGPNLAALLGRKVAGDPGFDYSPIPRRARPPARVAQSRDWRRTRHQDAASGVFCNSSIANFRAAIFLSWLAFSVAFSSAVSCRIRSRSCSC